MINSEEMSSSQFSALLSIFCERRMFEGDSGIRQSVLSIPYTGLQSQVIMEDPHWFPLATCSKYH